ncbi:FbpB family small basic protein [Oceanobacillus rekensis]|uniref:FbpB family small basic protein n=1 Tax=Oceanobacillus rekensis TaxID=937927 RepID=UPI000B43C002|nr:FbpB family small basic protein [Oceanobacillus rekensis]
MRPKLLNFEQLVNENKQELLNDEESISRIEMRLEKKREAHVLEQRKEFEYKTVS